MQFSSIESSATSDRREAIRPIVLYVEDHPVNVLVMQAFFEQRPGLELVVATTGKEALELAVGLHPVLLLLDLSLPDCHGSVLLPALRHHAGCRDTTAVAVTAEPCFDIVGTGFSELWAKPMYLAQVLGRLDALTASINGAGACTTPTAARAVI